MISYHEHIIKKFAIAQKIINYQFEKLEVYPNSRILNKMNDALVCSQMSQPKKKLFEK